MKLTEAEMRMVFQIESTNQNAALNEIYMTWRYAPNQAVKETAESLLDKLRPLSDQECMNLICKVQAEYRLPEKARTIGEMLAEARQQSGAQKSSGHDIMALERFDPATRHMIVFDVLTHDSPVGWKGEKMRLFLTDAGYSKASISWHRLSGLHPVLTSPASCFPSGTASRQHFPLRGSVSIPRTC